MTLLDGLKQLVPKIGLYTCLVLSTPALQSCQHLQHRKVQKEFAGVVVDERFYRQGKHERYDIMGLRGDGVLVLAQCHSEHNCSPRRLDQLIDRGDYVRIRIPEQDSYVYSISDSDLLSVAKRKQPTSQP